MPLYAYACADCAHEFQTLVRSGETPTCPACGGEKLERQLSLIAKPAPGGEGAGDAPPCGACPAFGDMA
jgi:putative FmdB family regulatory protein